MKVNTARGLQAGSYSLWCCCSLSSLLLLFMSFEGICTLALDKSAGLGGSAEKSSGHRQQSVDYGAIQLLHLMLRRWRQKGCVENSVEKSIDVMLAKPIKSRDQRLKSSSTGIKLALLDCLGRGGVGERLPCSSLGNYCWHACLLFPGIFSGWMPRGWFRQLWTKSSTTSWCSDKPNPASSDSF